MKKLFICLLALMLAAFPALGEGTETGAIEGPGFDSPEEAVSAYLEALKNGDVEGMLATFAIETYVAEMDAQAYLERLRAFSPTTGSMPLGGDYQRQAAVAMRYGQLANILAYQWMLYSWPEGYEEFGYAVNLSEDGAVEAFLAGLAENDAAARWQEMEIVEFVEPAQLSDRYLNESNQQNIARQAASYGCDELVSVVAKLDIGGEEWYQCMDVARYGGKWYNLSFSSNIGLLLGLSVYSGGLVPASELML